MFKTDSTRKGFRGWKQPRLQTPRSLHGERPKMLCAKCFTLFVPVRDGGGMRDNYPG